MRKLILSSALLAILPFAAMAQSSDRTYTYVEGGYQNVQSKGPDADGAYVKGSYEFGQSGVYAHGQYSYLDNDGPNFYPRSSSVGLGYYYTLNPDVDLLGEAAYERLDTNLGHDNGYRVSAGVRNTFNSRFEGLAKVNYRDGGDYYRSYTSATLGLQYKLNETWALNGEAELHGDFQSYQVGVRANF